MREESEWERKECERREGKRKKAKPKNQRTGKRKGRCITMEMELNRRVAGSYTNLTLLSAIMEECFGSIRALAKATGIRERTLNRRLDGSSQFKFEEILRLAYALCMTEQEVHEVFFARYLAD